MTKDTQGLINRSQLITTCDEKTIEAAWKKIQRKIDKSNFFSYSTEATKDGYTKITLWPFVVHSGSINTGFLGIDMLDLPNKESFIEDVFVPFKKKVLRRLCALCLTNNNKLIRASFSVDNRAGKDTEKVLRCAYNFVAGEFRKAYVNADAETFTPAGIMEDISTSLAEELKS